MESKHRLTRISSPDKQAIHFYYDVCPESPNGRRVVFFQFENEAPGDGRVVVANADGSDPRPISEPLPSDVHSAVRQQWLDDETVTYCPNPAGHLKTVVVSLKTGERWEMPGALRMYCAHNCLGLTTTHDFEALKSNLDDTVCGMDFRRREIRRLFTLRDALRVHPLGDRFEGVQHVSFMHTKWAPDGTRFLVLASNTNRLSGHKTGQPLPGKPIHSIFVADVDGGNLRYATEEDHHCVWGADSNHLCYFRKNPDGGQDFVSFPLDGTPPVPIMEKMRGKHATVNRDCTKVLADVTHWPEKGRAAIFLYDTRAKAHEVLATMTGRDFTQRDYHLHPTFSRNEQRVYFNAGENGFRSLFALDLAD